MAYRVFFLDRLKEGADPRDFERWVRDVARPFTERAESIDGYVVTRLDARLEGEEPPPYDYVEVVEVSDLEAYKAELSPERPEVKAFDEEWFRYVGEAVAVYGEVLE